MSELNDLTDRQFIEMMAFVFVSLGLIGLFIRGAIRLLVKDDDKNRAGQG